MSKLKVLYAIQATGNGHISRANALIPMLAECCDLTILVSGTEADVAVNYPVTYQMKGISFVFGKKGGIDFMATYKKLQSKRFLKDMRSLPVEQYDVVLNDFEPVSAWACKVKGVPCLAMSHQYAVIHKASPRPKKFDPLAWMILKKYAPVKDGIGFHFEAFGNNIFTPIIRPEIREARMANLGHYTVYLPACGDKKLIKLLSQVPDVQWHIFSKHTQKSYGEQNCWIRPVNNTEFIDSFTTCAGILCGAGFETPAEALFMGKKLLAIPMKSQYEQHCNAAGLQQLGVPVLKNLKQKRLAQIQEWVSSQQPLQVDYADNAAAAIRTVLEMAQQLVAARLPVQVSAQSANLFTMAAEGSNQLIQQPAALSQ